MLIIFIFVYANQEMVHGKIATCDKKNDGRCFIVKGGRGTQRQNVPKHVRRDTNGSLHALGIYMVNLELWPLKTIYLFGCVKETLSAASQECLFRLSYLDRFNRTFEDMELSSLPVLGAEPQDGWVYKSIWSPACQNSWVFWTVRSEVYGSF